MKNKIIQPRGKWVYVKQDAEESRVSDGGLYTPDSVDLEKPAYGTVISVGDEIKTIVAGDRVVFGAYAGEQIRFKDDNLKDVDFRLLHDDDVIAFLQD